MFVVYKMTAGNQIIWEVAHTPCVSASFLWTSSKTSFFPHLSSSLWYFSLPQPYHSTGPFLQHQLAPLHSKLLPKTKLTPHHSKPLIYSKWLHSSLSSLTANDSTPLLTPFPTIFMHRRTKTPKPILLSSLCWKHAIKQEALTKVAGP